MKEARKEFLSCTPGTPVVVVVWVRVAEEAEATDAADGGSSTAAAAAGAVLVYGKPRVRNAANGCRLVQCVLLSFQL